MPRPYAVALLTVIVLPCWLGRSAEDSTPTPVSGRCATVTNSIGMKLATFPSGQFSMGADGSDQDADKDESPSHQVTMKKPFTRGCAK